MRAAGRIVGEVLALMRRMAVPGTTTGDLDEAAGRLIADAGGRASFLDYSPPGSGGKVYPASICVSVDQEIVHGLLEPLESS